jgi:hypothetical protein
VPPLISYFPFDSGLGESSRENRWRAMMTWMRTTGILTASPTLNTVDDDNFVSPGTGLEVQIAVGDAWVQGHMFRHADDPSYLEIPYNDSGSTRYDLVTIRADFEANTILYHLIEDSIIPIQDQEIWDLPLAIITVEDQATEITSGDIEDVRVRSVQGEAGSNVISVSINAETVDTNTTINPNAYRLFNLTVEDDLTITISDFSSSSITSKVTIYLIQDGTGGHTVTFSGNVLFPAGIQPANTQNANSMDMYEFEWNGTNWMCVNNTSDYS